MFTQKSLIVSFALILALICTGIIATSAHTALPVHTQQSVTSYPRGIPAISSIARGNKNLLSFLDVRRYLNTRGFIGGSTLNGKAPVIRSPQLIDVLHLDSLLHFLLPEQPGNEQVYYAHLDGPLLVLPDLPLPILSTLLPSLSNLPVFLPHPGNLSWLGLFTAGNGSSAHLLTPGRMPDLSHLPNSVSASHAQSSSHVKSKNGSTVLASAYEVFDAHTGNLLTWG